MRKLSITEGLVELKLLDSRIYKAMDKDWAIATKKAEITPDNLKKFQGEVKANYQSIMDLIKERNKIKSAIVKSNAKTTLKVGDKKMTVAEAIDRKASIKYEKELLNTWKSNIADAEKIVTATNQRVQEKIDVMLSQLASSEKDDIASATVILSESYMEKNGLELIDPIDLKAKIEPRRRPAWVRGSCGRS